jgi:hypothetical protein
VGFPLRSLRLCEKFLFVAAILVVIGEEVAVKMDADVPRRADFLAGAVAVALRQHTP